MAHLTDIDHTAPADSLKSGAQVLNTWRTRIDVLNDALGDITTAEANQVENLGATTVSATQWGYLGALDQSLVTTASPTFNGLTLTSLTLNAAFTLGGTLTLGGTVAGGDYAFTNVGNMTFHNGSILASGVTASDTLILKANDTTCITLTTGTTDKVEIAALNSLTAIANLDIGSYTFTCAGLIDDTLTSGRVVFASTGGLLADDGDFLFATDTLTVTKIGAFQAVGAIDFNSQNMTSVDIDSGTIGGVTLDGAIAGGDQTFSNVGNMTFAAGSILASGDTNTNILLLKANDTTCITLTTAAIDQMDLASVYSLTAINNLDIGAYTFRCNGLIDDSLTSTRVIFATTNGQLADDADMTFSGDTLTVDRLALNSALTSTYNMLTLTPGGAMAASTIWKGVYINGDALDPSAANAALYGIHVDLSGVSITNSPSIEGICVSVPIGATSAHFDEQVHLNMDVSALVAGQHRTGFDVVVDGIGSTGGSLHGYDIAIVGAGLATVAGYATHTGIDVIHQHIGTFATADKCWEYDDSGSSYADVTTAFGSAGTDVAIFDDDDDAIFIGDAAVFSEIEVILATAASVDLKLTFWYSQAATFAQFYPADDTNGFTQDGLIRFEADDLAGWAAQTVNGSSQYYIKIIRTKNNVVTSPTEDTIKILDPTLYVWDSTGALTVLSIAVPTITTVTTFTAGGNLDIGAYTFRCNGLIDDSLTTGRVVLTTTNGQLATDSDITFDTATLSATNVTSSGTITTAALVATAHLDIGTYTFRCNGLIDDSLTSGRVIFSTTNGQLADDSDFTFLTDTLSIANITSSGTITTAGITATSNIDIGAYDFRAQTVTPDNLTSGRVVFATTNGQLTDDQDFTFATDTLTVTKLGAFEATGAINFGNQAMTNVDINSGAIDGAIIGANSAAALTCTTFTSTGIDDNADATAITISIDEVVSLGAASLTVGSTTPSAIQWGALGALVEWTAWVPTLTDDADLSGYTNARYFRVGDVCFYMFSAENKNVTTEGHIVITLPFTAANTGYSVPTIAVNDGGGWIAIPFVQIVPNTNQLIVYKTIAGGDWAGTEEGVYIRATGFFEIV